MQNAHDAPGADNGVSNQGNVERSGPESMIGVVQEAPGTTDSAVRHQELQATVEDGPNEERQRVGSETGPVDEMPILQERPEESETISTQQSQSPGNEGMTGINAVDSQEQNQAGGPVVTSIDEPGMRDTLKAPSRPEQSQQPLGGPIDSNAAAQATPRTQPSEQPSHPFQASAQQAPGPAILAPPLSSGVTSASPLSSGVTSASRPEPMTAQPPAASTAQPSQTDNFSRGSGTQPEERTIETDRPSIPLEHTRQPYSSQPANARFGPAASASGSVSSGQGSAGAGAAARGMPMCE
jgi:hypothetical protein